MVSERRTAERGSRTPRTELALKTLAADLSAHDRRRRTLEQTLVFAHATAAALYTADASDALTLAESVGVPRTLYGLRDTYPLTASSLLVDAHRAGAPHWLTAADLARRSDPRFLPPLADFSLGVLPLRDGGCLVVVHDAPGGFDTEDRACLAVIAEALTSRTPAPVPDDGHDTPRSAFFSLAMDTGRIEVDDAVLDLFGLARDDFDGRVETLLARTVPEDLPSLMSLVEPDHMSLGERELEFRILQPSGEPRWLRMRGRLLPADTGVSAGASPSEASDPAAPADLTAAPVSSAAPGAGRGGGAPGPPRLVGTVADASTLRPGFSDVTRIQRLAAALATAGTVRGVGEAVATALRVPLRADRLALAELEGDRLVVTVLDPPDPEAWPALWRSEWRSEWPDAPVGAMPTLAATLREGRITIRPAGAVLEPALAEVGPGGLAVLPLPADGRMAGACLLGWDAPHDFAPDERALLTAAAGLAGQALLRAHAFDAEHELIGMLQRTLLPRRLPRLPGAEAVARYLPTTAGLEVGGDWYDVIPLPDNHVALVIGDVQGHNASAATLMGQMRTALRAYAVEGHPPDVVVSHANRLLVGLESDLFATCCYVDIDMEEGFAWCVRAGHLPPVLRLPDGRTETVEFEGGPPLGVVAQADYPMSPLRFQPGTVLALTTDGLVESAEVDLDTGLERLAARLAAGDPARLGAVADALLTDANRGDDVALLLLRYDGMAQRPLRESWSVWRVPEAVRHARRYTRRVLRTWGLTEEADTALLVVSELVTNALVHTDGPVRLDLTLVNHRLRIAVADSSPRTPIKPTGLGWEATGGRGILLVEAMSAAWGSVPASGGKQVWAELTPDPEL
ncbi:anti-sigma regulatory factor (Ser/Thr protein kinase)/PAS domain-containing protein [Streptomyces sp. B3I7]|uniref:SpoIIE family protein phosphatase n=1 Tax=Streptomyces sp. B3I7 TaxID=3042269 RepID=UPI0027875CE1|nr:SpoIIE family protein phosphatase [Streptomyces sp. B3I7]MDQ0809285.1 anti-sigma regulatory factor (Ser/Thr protein kinase)/PAS domain-containing protein [Streptomyces sp. B3I7]